MGVLQIDNRRTDVHYLTLNSWNNPALLQQAKSTQPPQCAFTLCPRCQAVKTLLLDAILPLYQALRDRKQTEIVAFVHKGGH